MFFFANLAVSCGNSIVVDGVSDIQRLPPSSSQCLSVHQSWKTASVPPKYRKLQATWLHKDVRHVLWTDKGNLDLVEHYYPAWSSHYAQLLSLPSHSGGAVMASAGPGCCLHGVCTSTSTTGRTFTTSGVVATRRFRGAGIRYLWSPFLITSATTSCTPLAGNPFFMHVGRSIERTLEFIEHPCPDDRGRDGTQVSANCPLTGAFTNRWTMSVTWLMKTEQITGPPILDKTYTQLSLSGSPDVSRVSALSTSDYFGSVGSISIGPGKYATHWHANSWVTLNPVRLMPTLSFTVILLLVLLLAASFYVGKHERVYRSKCMRS